MRDIYVDRPTCENESFHNFILSISYEYDY